MADRATAAMAEVYTLPRDTLTVSDRGLRHGLLAERFGSYAR